MTCVLNVLAIQSVHAQDPIHKVGRGIVNILTGWLEIPKQVHYGFQEKNPIAGISLGLMKGVGLAILRGGVGVFEAVTFPFPYPNRFASPYAQIELPDFAWE